MSLTGKVMLAGVIGWPVTHSLSPVLHGHWLAEHGIDGAMVPLAAGREDLTAVINGVRRAGFKGVNVTVPHKESAFAIAHTVDAAAQAAGAANLLVFRDGKIEGRNTDSIGLAESLRESIGDLNGKTVVLLGAGGAARGALLALEMLGAASIHLLNRDAHRAKTLASSLAPHVKAPVHPGSLDDWKNVAGAAALLVNSTSAGMGNNPSLDIDLGALPKDAAVCDIVYNPLETKLLQDAGSRGHKTIDGLGMLLHQAVPSFEAFFGVKPSVTPALRAALVKVLGANR
ncbi:MAG: shikimate dehydrogenase [Alphaproteobacteria bacterium]|nr:shikimate dehydrogenase [Alphaproteobacteria bacterium]